MKKIYPNVEKHGERTLSVNEVLNKAAAVRIVFTDPQRLSDALSGLTLSEIALLSYLLSRCIKNYLTQHPAAFSRSFLFASDDDTQMFDTLPSQNAKNEAHGTSTS